MTRCKYTSRGRSAVILLGTATLLALGIQAARIPAPASSAPSPSTSMAGMAMQAPATALNSALPVSMLHKRIVRLKILNFTFLPATIIVSPGTRIIWTNKDGDPHTASSTKNIWASPALDTNGTFGRTFTRLGTFPYFCAIHPFMHGTIIVKR